jgi:elongation factor Ts
MQITANDVKELRERTGAGMMECKKALVESAGDIDAAIEAMRKAGTAKAAKKAGRITAEGLIEAKVSTDGRIAIMLEVNCETDFVGKDTHFKTFVAAVAETALREKATEVTQLSGLALQGSTHTVEEARNALVIKVGENIQIRRLVLLEATGTVGIYVHGGRIGALVALSTDNASLAKDIAMHVAASNPQVLHKEDVSPALIQQEREIFIAQSADSGKPADIIEKMVEGRISKFVQEISLVNQPFVKNPSVSVEQLLKEAKAEVTQFTRFEVGEGVEKVVEDFAEAVKAAQASGEV